MGSLLRSQLRLAMRTLLPLLAFALGGCPSPSTSRPGLADVRLLGMPARLAGARAASSTRSCACSAGCYVRRAERNEQDFAELVEIAERPSAERP